MDLFDVLKKSFDLMLLEPKIFVPRLFTTLLYTTFLVYSTKLSLDISLAINREVLMAQAVNAVPDLNAIYSEFSDALFFFLVFFIVVYIIDIISYGMYAKISEDYYNKKPVQLLIALKHALGRLKILFMLGAIVLAFGAFFIICYMFFGQLYFYTQKLIFALISLALIFVGLVLFAILFFFAVPVAVLKSGGLVDTLSTSFKLGMKHKFPVVKTNFLFVALILVTMLVAVYTEFKGAVAMTALIAFSIGRLLQAIVYTYISIVNPSLYLHLEEATDGNK